MYNFKQKFSNHDWWAIKQNRLLVSCLTLGHLYFYNNFILSVLFRKRKKFKKSSPFFSD